MLKQNKNRNEALRWVKLAAEQNHSEAKIEINTISITGKWCEIDTEQDLSFAKETF